MAAVALSVTIILTYGATPHRRTCGYRNTMVMGAAWLCLHIWEHYLYVQDREFLSEKYDTLKEAAEFFLDFLIEDKKADLLPARQFPLRIPISQLQAQKALSA